MNFSTFAPSQFPASLPSMQQFATKFTTDPVMINTTGMLNAQNTVTMITTLAGDNTGGIQYVPVTNTTNLLPNSQNPRITLPASNIQVVNSGTSPSKYSPGTTVIGWENMSLPMHHFTTVDPKVVSMPYSQGNVLQANSNQTTMWPVRLLTAEQLANEFALEMEGVHDIIKVEKDLMEKDMLKHDKNEEKMELIQIPVNATWSDSAVTDYLSRLPLGLQHIIKLPDDLKKEDLLLSDVDASHVQQMVPGQLQQIEQHNNLEQTATQEQTATKKKSGNRTKKPTKIKEKKPKYRPGEIRISTALDGSTLFCCPECHMAYPERYALEQHLAGHKSERRFVCDVCGAGLKRKEHLDQHKRGHSQERPFVCTICMKGFKRNEHLTRHYVVHSGDKSYTCQECRKAFSRKDHLHKHAQTHIAKRVKAELSQQTNTPSVPVPAPVLS